LGEQQVALDAGVAGLRHFQADECGHTLPAGHGNASVRRSRPGGKNAYQCAD
jgi:hypothetical protein